MRPTLLDPKELYPHEDLIESILKARVNEILTSPYIYPIIVEKNYKIVLDGHHRWFAFLELGKKVPAYLVSYSEISLDSWSLKSTPEFIKVKREGICVNETACSNDLFAFYWALHFEMTKAGINPLEAKSTKGELKLPPLTKDDVIRAAKEGYVYPPKTTRHVINFNVEPVKNASCL